MTEASVPADTTSPRGVKRVRIVEGCPGAFPSRGGRRTFWVEAPRRHVVDRLAFCRSQAAASAVAEEHRDAVGDKRHARRHDTRKGHATSLRPAAAPHRLCLAFTGRRGRPDHTAFLQPIPETLWVRAEVTERVQAPPTYFSVPIYVWQDSTLREMLELALARSGAAAAVLLGDEEARRVHLHGRDHGNAQANSSVALDAGEGKKEAPAVRRRGAQTVDIWHVTMGGDRMPRVSSKPIGTLSLTKPPKSGEGGGDRVTIEELRTSHQTPFRFGDLIVVAPAEV